MGTPDKAKAAEQWKRWYAEHRDDLNARKRLKRAAGGRAAEAAKQRERYYADIETSRAKGREYSRAAHARKPRAKRFALNADNNLRSRYGRHERLDWENLPLGPCVYCGRDDETVSWDHVIPLSTGGANKAWNCVRCCPTCNGHKHAKTPGEWLDPAVAEARRERKRAYIRQWHRDHYAELYAKRREKREATGHW